MKRSRERIAKTEALFRNVNEEIRDAAERFDSETGEFVCECGDPACTEHIELPLHEYEDVRQHATRFVVRPGHGKGPLETIVDQNHRYSVIDKVDHVVASVARRLNPRPETS
jgi:hypothetical protein